MIAEDAAPDAGTELAPWALYEGVRGPPAGSDAISTSREILLFGGVPPPVRYLPAIDDWQSTVGTRTTTVVAGMTTVADGRAVFVFGGAHRHGPLTNDAAMYDAWSERWTPLPRSPLRARRDAVGMRLNTTFVVMGGVDDNGETLRDGAAYDTLLERWTTISELPVDVAFVHGVHTVAMRAFVWITTSAGRGGLVIYDLVQDAFTLSNAPAALTGGASTLHDGRIFVTNSGQSAWFEPTTNTWTEPVPAPDGVVASFSLDSRLGAVTDSAVHQFDGSAWQPVLQLPEDFTPHLVRTHGPRALLFERTSHQTRVVVVTSSEPDETCGDETSWSVEAPRPGQTVSSTLAVHVVGPDTFEDLSVELENLTVHDKLQLGAMTSHRRMFDVSPMPAGEYRLRVHATVDGERTCRGVRVRLTKPPALFDLMPNAPLFNIGVDPVSFVTSCADDDGACAVRVRHLPSRRVLVASPTNRVMAPAIVGTGSHTIEFQATDEWGVEGVVRTQLLVP